jgi:predicted esterase
MSFQTGANRSLSVPKPKSAILCLHGGGTNKSIFEIQTIRIQRVLSEHFEFVFLSAPFDSGPGPDVLPSFEGCGPFFRWTLDRGPAETPEETKVLLSRLAKEQIMKDGRGFVGVLGFSQGARLATGLLLEQQLGKGIDWGDGLGFGVICNGTSPPLTSHLSKEEKDTKIAIPTLHLVGLRDPWREESRRLRVVHCEEEQAAILEFDVGHRLPILPEDNAKLAAVILRMHSETSGIGKVSLVSSP